MAATADGARITGAKQTAQLAVSRAVQRQTVLLWRLLDPTALDRTASQWALAQLRAILAGREATAANAHRFYRQFSAAETGAVPDLPLPNVNNPAVSAAILTSLEVTGPVRVKQIVASGEPTSRAMTQALNAVTGSTQRHVLNGGREADLGLMNADPNCDRYARVTDGNACAFCGMLASRGAVYLTDTAAALKVHDHCGCAVEPVYDLTQWTPPSGTLEWQSRWADYTSTGQRLTPAGFHRFVRKSQ